MFEFLCTSEVEKAILTPLSFHKVRKDQPHCSECHMDTERDFRRRGEVEKTESVSSKSMSTLSYVFSPKVDGHSNIQTENLIVKPYISMKGITEKRSRFDLPSFLDKMT